MMKPQELRDLAPLGRHGARSQSPYFARGFILLKELHSLHSAARESLGEFARPNSPQLFERLRRSVIDQPTAAAYYYGNSVRESQVMPFVGSSLRMPGSTIAPTASLWPYFAEQIIPRLTADDDSALWRAVIESVIADAAVACEELHGKARVIAQIGRCSHWLAPNKARWITSEGEFTWPSGYQPKAGFFGGLPEFDWHLFWERDDKERAWRHIPKVRTKRPLLLRVAIPARTALHLRASIQAMWAPAPRPDLNLSRLLYGFRKVDAVWQHRAYRAWPKGRGRGITNG